MLCDTLYGGGSVDRSVGSALMHQHLEMCVTQARNRIVFSASRALCNACVRSVLKLRCLALEELISLKRLPVPEYPELRGMRAECGP